MFWLAQYTRAAAPVCHSEARVWGGPCVSLLMCQAEKWARRDKARGLEGVGTKNILHGRFCSHCLHNT